MDQSVLDQEICGLKGYVMCVTVPARSTEWTQETNYWPMLQ